MAPMLRLLLLSTAFTFSNMSNAEDDISYLKLQKALAAFDLAEEKYRNDVTAWLDKRETEARKRGDKGLVDQITIERDAFTTKSIQPKTLPRTIGNQFATAKRNMEFAYKAAIKDHTKAGRDEEATATEKELDRFVRGRNIPEDAIQFQGRWYKVFDTPVVWNVAKEKCDELGGHLAIIQSSDENEFLVRQLEQLKMESAWIGATDQKAEGEWVWVDGTKLGGFSNWGIWNANDREPNNCCGGEHFLSLMTGLKGKPGWRGRWGDHGNQAECFICQWD